MERRDDVLVDSKPAARARPGSHPPLQMIPLRAASAARDNRLHRQTGRRLPRRPSIHLSEASCAAAHRASLAHVDFLNR